MYLFSCELWLTQFPLNFYLWKFVRPGIAEGSSEEYFLFSSARPLLGSNRCKLSCWFVEFGDHPGGVNSTWLVTNLCQG